MGRRPTNSADGRDSGRRRAQRRPAASNRHRVARTHHRDARRRGDRERCGGDIAPRSGESCDVGAGHAGGVEAILRLAGTSTARRRRIGDIQQRGDHVRRRVERCDAVDARQREQADRTVDARDVGRQSRRSARRAHVRAVRPAVTARTARPAVGRRGKHRRVRRRVVDSSRRHDHLGARPRVDEPHGVLGSPSAKCGEPARV